MDDIRRPGSQQPRQPQRPGQPGQQLPPQQSLPQQPLTDFRPIPLPESEPLAPLLVKPKRKKHWPWVVGVILLILAAALAGAYFWYQSQLSPVNSTASERIRVTIESGSTPKQIAQQLKDENLIKNTNVFAVYTRVSGTQNSLQAGSYHLSQSETLPQIVDHLVGGKVDTFDITFLPGATLAQNRKVLIEAGYSETEVDAAFSASYGNALFAGKPANADLEGYIYGETYRISSGSSVADILQQTFTQYEKVITENDFVAKFQARGLNLYQGITLASIVQRESIGGDEPQIAQVFYTRLAMGMELGSDVTYQYIADKTGVTRDPNLDSPYNTRRYPGLPPGPIAAPGLAALQAVANPAAGDYVFFLSGDDDTTYYARTLEEHEANIRNHCQEKCLII
jgi:UPF0755 protein